MKTAARAAGRAWTAGRGRGEQRALHAAAPPVLGLGRPVQKGVVSPMRAVPKHILAPPYAASGIDPMSGQTYSLFELGSAELEHMRDACRHARDTLEYAGSLVKPGVSTEEIDRKVHEHVIARGIYPSPINYRNFPKCLCSSVNEVLCHGIPDDRELIEGDIVNLDVSTFVEGFHGDTSRTFRVGQVSDKADKLVRVTEECLQACIDVCGPGVQLNKVGTTVAEFCKTHGYEASATFCGHGIGPTFHMLPYVLHFENAQDFELVPGLVFTIEPILCEGSAEHTTWDDGWTVATMDGGLTAQAEHTLVITNDGVEVLT